MWGSFKEKLRKIQKEDLLKESIAPFILKISGLVLGYLFTYFASKKYGAEVWGAFSLITTITLFCSYIFKLGFDTALLKFAAEYNTQGKLGALWGVYLKMIKIAIPLSIIATFSILLKSHEIAINIFKNSSLEPFLFYGSLAILPNVMIFINSEGLRGLGRIKEYVFLQSVGLYMFSILLFFLFVFLGAKTSLIIMQIYLISNIITFIISAYWWHKKIFKSIAHPGLSITDIFKVSFPMLWSNIMFVIIGWTDTLMLGILSTEQTVGVYNICLKTSFIVILPLLIINGIIGPQFASYYSNNDLFNLKKSALNSSRLIFLLTIPIFCAIVIFPKFILGIFGQEFTSGISILLFLCLGQFINALCGSTDIFLQMTGNERFFRNVIITATSINIILNIILIPLYAGLGSAIASLISLAFWNIISVVYIKKKFNINMIFIPFVKKTIVV